MDGLCDESRTTCDTHSLVRTKEGYVLGFVEIDDQGIFRDDRAEQNQQRAILNYLKDQQNLYVVLFVHGWHHSAAIGDKNVTSFRRRLADATARHPSKHVVGIFVGWRGDSVTVPYLNALTFWERKNVSEEVGRNALVGFLLELENIKRRPADENALLLTGHSFGGSVLYNAVHQTLLQRLIQSSQAAEGPQQVSGFGDLVVLVNPAIEAMRFSPLVDASQVHARNHAFPSHQPVRLLVGTSPGDFATATAFPLGRKLSTLLESHEQYAAPQYRRRSEQEKIDQATLDTTAIGHFRRYMTHEVGMSHRRESNQCTVRLGWLREAVQRKDAMDRQGGSSIPNGEGWSTKSEEGSWNVLGQEGIPKQLKIHHRVGFHPYSPYWFVELDERTMITNHNDISGPNFWCLVDLVLLKESATQTAGAPPLPSPEAVPLSDGMEAED